MTESRLKPRISYLTPLIQQCKACKWCRQNVHPFPYSGLFALGHCALGTLLIRFCVKVSSGFNPMAPDRGECLLLLAVFSLRYMRFLEKLRGLLVKKPVFYEVCINSQPPSRNRIILYYREWYKSILHNEITVPHKSFPSFLPIYE